MKNKFLPHALLITSLVSVLAYKKVVQEEPWAIGLSQVITLWVILIFIYLINVNFNWVKQTVTRFFTEKDSPINLAIFRIVFFAYMLFPLKDPQLIWFSELPKDLQFAPMGMGWLLPHLPINGEIASSALIIFKMACFTAMLGIATRTSTFIAALTGFYVIGIPQFYGNVSHNHHSFWFLVIFAASRCADALSFDAVFNGIKKADRNQPTAIPHAANVYALPLRFMWLLIGLCYFFPGFWKLWNSGTAWILGDNLRNHMYYVWIGTDHWVPSIRIDQWPWLCRLTGAYVIFFEMVFIFLLFLPTTRYVAMVMGLSFHNMTFLILKIRFFILQICYVSFINWASFFKWLGQKMYHDPLIVLYDGSCSFCRRAVAFLQAFDVFNRIDYLDLHSSNAQSIRSTMKVTHEDLNRDMHAVIGQKTVKGYIAYRHIASRIPLLWPLVPFLYLGPVQMIGDKVYRSVADHRSCRLPPKDALINEKDPSTRLITVVGIILLSGALYYGSIGKGSGWPFACYPTFSEIAWDRFRTIECEVIYKDGSEKILHIQSLKSHMPVYKLDGLIGKIFSIKNKEVQNKKFLALWEVFLSIDPELINAKTIRFYFYENFTDPKKWDLNPVNKTMAFEFQVNQPN